MPTKNCKLHQRMPRNVLSGRSGTIEWEWYDRDSEARNNDSENYVHVYGRIGERRPRDDRKYEDQDNGLEYARALI